MVDGANFVLAASGIYCKWMEASIDLLLFLPDSDKWTPEEKESFEKAFHTYGKDFHLIQKQVKP